MNTITATIKIEGVFLMTADNANEVAEWLEEIAAHIRSDEHADRGACAETVTFTKTITKEAQ